MSANKGEAYAKKEWGPDRLFKIIQRKSPGAHASGDKRSFTFIMTSIDAERTTV